MKLVRGYQQREGGGGWWWREGGGGYSGRNEKIRLGEEQEREKGNRH